MHAICNDKLFAFVFIDELSSVGREVGDPNDVIRPCSHYNGFVGGDLDVIEDPSVASETHDVFAIVQVNYLDDCVFFLGAGCQEVVAHKFDSEAAEMLRFHLVDELLWYFTNIPISKKLIEVLGSFLPLLDVCL